MRAQFVELPKRNHFTQKGILLQHNTVFKFSGHSGKKVESRGACWWPRFARLSNNNVVHIDSVKKRMAVSFSRTSQIFSDWFSQEKYRHFFLVNLTNIFGFLQVQPIEETANHFRGKHRQLIAAGFLSISSLETSPAFSQTNIWSLRELFLDPNILRLWVYAAPTLTR